MRSSIQKTVPPPTPSSGYKTKPLGRPICCSKTDNISQKIRIFEQEQSQYSINTRDVPIPPVSRRTEVLSNKNFGLFIVYIFDRQEIEKCKCGGYSMRRLKCIWAKIGLSKRLGATE